MLTSSSYQVLNFSSMQKLPEYGLEILRLARSCAKFAVFVHNHAYRKDRQRDKTKNYRGAKYADVSYEFCKCHCFLPCATVMAGAAFVFVATPVPGVDDRMS